MLGASVALSLVSAANFLVDDDAGTPGALRHAIAQSNGNFEEDTITIDPSVFFIKLLDDSAVPRNGGDGGNGGGIFNEGNVVLRDCKIVLNKAGLAGSGGQGGGIWEGDNGGGGIGFGGRGVTIANFIVCLNQAGTDPNIEIGFLFDGNNLVGVNPDSVACRTQTYRVTLWNKLESILAQPDPSAIFWNAAAGS